MELFLANLVLSLPLVGVYALFGVGVVATYQASRVLNLAHGAMAMVPAYIAYEATLRGVPTLVTPVIGALVGALVGVAVERAVLRPLRSQTPSVQTVGTVAVLGVLIAAAAKLFGTASRVMDSPFGEARWNVFEGVLRAPQVGMFAVAVVLTAVVFSLFRFTDIGLAMRAAAQNRRAAALMGVNPNTTITVAWLLAGATAGVAGTLLAGATSLDPYGLPLAVLPAFVAALIGGLDSLPGVLVGSVVVGLAIGIVPALSPLPLVGSVARQTGSPQVILSLLTFAVLARRGEPLVAADIRAEGT